MFNQGNARVNCDNCDRHISIFSQSHEYFSNTNAIARFAAVVMERWVDVRLVLPERDRRPALLVTVINAPIQLQYVRFVLIPHSIMPSVFGCEGNDII